jgi:predicted AAA+ superfamily ATPase
VITITKNIVYLVIMIKRALFQKLNEKFNKGKAIVLLGPRQVGKTTLINTCLEGKDFLFLNADDP